jgi:co-chaperonin GroES (HSP10)
MNITPQNRHILIEVLDETEDDTAPSAFLLPEGYEKPKSEHIKVKVLDDSACSLSFGSHVVVPRHMIQEIDIGATTFNLVLENYVLASVE